jgi:hypothetical protein
LSSAGRGTGCTSDSSPDSGSTFTNFPPLRL